MQVSRPGYFCEFLWLRFFETLTEETCRCFCASCNSEADLGNLCSEGQLSAVPASGALHAALRTNVVEGLGAVVGCVLHERHALGGRLQSLRFRHSDFFALLVSTVLLRGLRQREELPEGVASILM
ncbi:hypothetical protein SAMN06265373_1186 [Shimia sagamensis]|uniref:Uncharacterized protein n=1 Tax=Shimia sagamensis TaxID=1566352 RepID=A0ABY1PL68_9RHOB|nr:hypothetical protein SAMN06265373_1186 [Shimia sagamensis]